MIVRGMIWFSLAFLVLVVMHLVMAWRIQALKNSVAEMWEAVHFYAMTGGTGKWAWKIKGADDVERMYKALGVIRRDDREGKNENPVGS